VKLALIADREGLEWVATVDSAAGTASPIAASPSLLEGQQSLLRVAMTRHAPDPIRPPLGLDAVRLLSPVPEPPSIRDFYAFEEHVATAMGARGRTVPAAWYEVPAFYFTNPVAVLAHGDPVHAPRGCERLDYELEVAAVVGVEVDGADDLERHPADWRSVVGGFCVMNDWSARDVQATEMAVGLGPAKGKDFATSLGPWLVTPDEFPATAGSMTASVDGVQWSSGDLAALHHPWPTMLAQAARDTRLRPGDVLGTGTVGTGCILELSLVHGSDRFPWLAPGQRVELTVEGIGTLTNEVVARP
jgi:2-keto-4-pentenoate hydratase/2-oxohepta-3-ene-1,7-dioic acid hydratase in catechol pathway